MTKKVRVLQFIVSTGFYGAERWVLALARNLDKSKTSCDLAVTMESSKQNMEIVRQFPTSAGKCFEIPLKGRFDLTSVRHLSRILSERKIDVIHTHGYKSDLLGLLAARIAGVRCVSTPHGFGEPKDLKLRLYIRIGAFCLRFFDKVVPLSNQLMDETRAFGVPVERLSCIKNGVDLSEVDDVLHGICCPSKEGKIIGYIGQMIPRKKVHHILDIFESLAGRHDDLHLRLIGDGDERSLLEAKAAVLPCVKRIKFLGFRTDRLEQLKQFDLFVMTSSSEGIPRSLMEAMAMKIPIAAYNIQGIDDLIIAGKTGLLADYGDKAQMAQNWESLLFDEPCAAAIASEARRFVIDNFSAMRMAREYENLYRTLV